MTHPAGLLDGLKIRQIGCWWVVCYFLYAPLYIPPVTYLPLSISPCVLVNSVLHVPRVQAPGGFPCTLSIGYTVGFPMLKLVCFSCAFPNAFPRTFSKRFPKHTLTILVCSNIGCWERPNWSSWGVPPCFSCPRTFPRAVPQGLPRALWCTHFLAKKWN